MSIEPTVELQSDSEAATFELGRRLARLLNDRTTVAVAGDLGTGKSVLCRGVARGLGVTEAVTSPTFAIVQEYVRPAGNWLYHLDMYRIGDEQAALAFGVEDYLFPEDGLSLIEWPECINGLLAGYAAAHLRRIQLRHLGPEKRGITLPAELAKGLNIPGLSCVATGRRDRLVDTG